MNQLLENSLHIYDVTLVTSYLIGLEEKLTRQQRKSIRKATSQLYTLWNEYEDAA